jgi:hypothetical protein
MLLAPITRAIIKLLGLFDRSEENDELVRYTHRDENFVRRSASKKDSLRSVKMGDSRSTPAHSSRMAG